jgi:hypothetical protein
MCLYEPVGSVIRLLFIRNIDDEECIAYAKDMIAHIKQEIPSVVICAHNESEQ